MSLKKGSVNAVEFSPDGTRIVVGNSESSAIIVDASTFEELGAFNGHNGSINAVAFLPDGNAVVTGASDGQVLLWEISDLFPSIEVERIGNALLLKWNSGTLQYSEAIEGKWEDIPEATSPFVVDRVGAMRFFRSRSVQ